MKLNSPPKISVLKYYKFLRFYELKKWNLNRKFHVLNIL